MLNTAMVVLRCGVDGYSFITGFMGCTQTWPLPLLLFLLSFFLTAWQIKALGRPWSVMSYLCCKNRTHCSKDALGTFWMYVSLFPEFGRRACVCLSVCAYMCVRRGQSCPTCEWMGKHSVGGLATSLIIITEMGLRAMYLKGINKVIDVC